MYLYILQSVSVAKLVSAIKKHTSDAGWEITQTINEADCVVGWDLSQDWPSDITPDKKIVLVNPVKWNGDTTIGTVIINPCTPDLLNLSDDSLKLSDFLKANAK